MKSYLRSLAADMFQLTGITALARGRQRSALAILCYHRILPAPDRDAYILPTLAVTPEAFDAQVAIAAKYYRCLSLREAMLAWHQGKSDRPLLAMTFDDGYADNAVHAAPILERHGVRATFFVVSGLVGSTQRAWYDLLGRLVQRTAKQPIPELCIKPDEDDPVAVWIAEHFRHRHGLSVSRIVTAAKALPHALRCEVINRLHAAAPDDLAQDPSDRMMSLDQVKSLASKGHEVASHSATHPLLPQLSDEELQSELTASKLAIEHMTGVDVIALAYPNGDQDDRVADATRAAGYQFAVTMQPGLNRGAVDPMRLRRMYVTQERFSRNNGDCHAGLFQLELSGLADRVFFRRHRSATTP